MWHSKEEIEIALLEYAQGNELIKHYDTIVWAVASIFIPISLGLLGLSFNEQVVKQGIWAILILCISSLSLYSIWFIIERRCAFYMNIIFHRLHKLEENYGMDTHLRIDREDRVLPSRKIKRTSLWIRVFFTIILCLAWLLRIFLFWILL